MKKIVIAICIAIFAINLTGCNSDTLTDKSLRNILEQNSENFSGMDLSTVTIKAVEDLDNEEYDKFVLFSADLTNSKRMYFPIFINTKEKLTYEIYWEAPLSNVMQHVLLDEDEETNIAIFNEMAECVKTSGMDCFSTEESAIGFVNDITVKKDIIDIKTVRASIADQMLSASGRSSDEAKVFFEKGTAIPKYFSVKSFEMRKNPKWGTLGNYSNLLDYSSKAEMTRVFGPEYVEYDVWLTAEIDAETVGSEDSIVGSFDSIEEIKKKFDVDDQETISTKTFEDVANEQQSENTNNNESSDKLYRVRTSYDDAQSQIGAFKVLDNAKQLADSNKAKGYKVFDENGNIVYEP